MKRSVVGRMRTCRTRCDILKREKKNSFCCSSSSLDSSIMSIKDELDLRSIDRSIELIRMRCEQVLFIQPQLSDGEEERTHARANRVSHTHIRRSLKTTNSIESINLECVDGTTFDLSWSCIYHIVFFSFRFFYVLSDL